MKHSIQAWLALSVSMVFVGSSCNMLDDHFPEADDYQPDSVGVKMRITILGEGNGTDDDASADTRAEASPTRADVSPTAYDVYINPSYYNATFFQDNSTSETKPYICNMHASTLTLQSSSGDVATYIAHGYMDTIPSGGHSWITVVNVPDYPYKKFKVGTTKLYDLMYYYSYFDWPAGQVPSQLHPIPMYGIFGTRTDFSTKWKVSDFEYDLTYSGGYEASSNLLRGLARIIVRSNDQLTNVKLLKGNTKGLAIEKVLICDVPKITSGNPNWGDAQMNIPGENSYYPDLDRGVADSLAFTRITTLNRKYAYNYVLYVPEFRNVGVADADSTGLCFDLAGKHYHIPFGVYGDDGSYAGPRLNINRDYAYEFILTVETDAPKIKYSVLPWTSESAPLITFD